MQKPRSKVILKSSCWQDDLIRMFLQEMHAVHKVIIDKSQGEVPLFEQDTIENVF